MMHFKLLVAAIAVLILIFETEALNPKINPSIFQSLKSSSSSSNIDVIVRFKKSTSVLKQLNYRSFLSRSERLQSVKNILSSSVNLSQKRVTDFLSKSTKAFSTNNISIQKFWIANAVLIRNVDLKLIDTIANFEEVQEIIPNASVHLMKPIKRSLMQRKRTTEEIEWGVEAIGAPQVWKRGYNGSGIIIGSLDTGARWTHELISENFVGLEEYGWFDPINMTDLPFDDYGHGTHTIGTMVGKNGFGAAPGAKWMSCRGLSLFEGDLSTILSCFQFMACPTDVRGENPKCEKAPHIVSNSWGYGYNGMDFDEVMDAYHSAGIIPVFSAGNNGEDGCNSTGSPSDGHAISVGSVGPSDRLSPFSSLGPGGFTSKYGAKPDILAPGQDTLSSTNHSDTAYEIMEGTSMACPLVSGSIAMLLQKDPELKYEAIRRLLYHGAVTTIRTPKLNCGCIDDSQIPNHSMGYGRINIHASMATSIYDADEIESVETCPEL